MVEESERLAASCKRLLANKIILAWIMKHCMEEYHECSIAYIVEMAENGEADMIPS